ncbi:DUF1549 domain-containing protein [bacterium]|nr:DUF1549 domain-containing protein [bacterium]
MKKLLILIAIFYTSSIYANPQIDFFESKIRPVLASQCYSCHSSKNKDIKGGLVVDSKDGLLKGGDSGAAIIPGQPENSLLIQAMNHDGYEMPPSKKLPDYVIQNFYLWIKMGAPDPRIPKDTKNKEIIDAKKLWSFRPISASSLDNIDKLVNFKIKQEKLESTNIADDYTLIRRLYIDLLGVLPKPIEILSYVKNQDTNKYDKLVDKLLDDFRFGQKWSRHWLDIVRYADSTGKDQNIVYPYAWKYRDYVIDSFNRDKPYDLFIKEQIAGDLLPNKDYAEYNKNLVATGFLSIGTKNLNVEDKQYKADIIDEQIDVITRGFLGLTLSCARCHDHKFDAISQQDYYKIYAIFENTKILDGVDRGNNNIGYYGSFGFALNDIGKNLYKEKNYAKWKNISDIVNLQNKIKSVYHYNTNLNENDKKNVESEINKLLKQLEEKYQNVDESTHTMILKTLFANDPIMCVADNDSLKHTTKLQIRGEINNLGEEVARGLPEIFATKNKNHDPSLSTNSGRLELASWISDDNNVLTYRMHVNRIWNILIGKGIIDSFDNFGILAGEPSNLKLLDFLAKDFIKNKKSNKYLIKSIVTSNVYKRSSVANDESYLKDPDNIYFWRMNEKRILAEIIRDVLLDIENKLLYDGKDNTFLSSLDKQRVNESINKVISDRLNRSVFLPSPRDFPIEMLDLFDRPDNNLMSTNRAITTVPTQALYMMNNVSITNHCNEVSKNLLYDLKDKPVKDKVNYLYLQYLSRNVTDSEFSFVEEYISSSDQDEHKIYSQLIQILISTGEFRTIK